MDFIHKILNVVLPLFALSTILLFSPPFLIYKLFKYCMKSFTRTEKLAGKVVLITGASSGIGEHLAYEYAKRGASLALVARREDRLQAVAAKAVRLGSPDALVIRADVSEVEDCKRLVEETVNHFGQLDYLVNNAGVLQAVLIEDSTEFSNVRSIMDINFWGSVYCTQFAIPHLKKGRGKIVVISSVGSWLNLPRLSFYCASKAAQVSFFEALKAEIGSEIGITIVTPGIVDSEMTGDQFFLEDISFESCHYGEDCSNFLDHDHDHDHVLDHGLDHDHDHDLVLVDMSKMQHLLLEMPRSPWDEIDDF